MGYTNNQSEAGAIFKKVASVGRNLLKIGSPKFDDKCTFQKY